MHELILGGQRSGKSRCAEARALDWLAGGGLHTATLIATAVAADAEMQARIHRHRIDRELRVPKLRTVEEPRALPAALRACTQARQLVIVDCLTLWLTNLLMPAGEQAALADAEWHGVAGDFIDALRSSSTPVILVSNEIGLGVTPLGVASRRFVDELGRLHQRCAEVCSKVTLMVAGLEVKVKP